MASSFQLQCQIQQNSVPEFSGIETTFFYKCGLIYIEEYFCGEKASLRHQPETFPGKNKFAEGPFHPGTADNQTAEQLFGC